MESNDEQDAMKQLGDHCDQLCSEIWHRLTTLKSGLFPPDLLLPTHPGRTFDPRSTIAG